MIGIEIVQGQVIVTPPDAIFVHTKQEFIAALRAWGREGLPGVPRMQAAALYQGPRARVNATEASWVIFKL